MIAELLLPLGLAFIMFTMGLALAAADFRLVVTRPKAMAVGLFCQMALLPMVALLVVALFSPRPEFAMGLIILAACPGGITSNLLTHLAGGATALAVSLTAVTSVAGVVTLPLIVNAGLAGLGLADGMVELPVARMSLGVFAIATLPLMAGMALNAKAPALAARLEKPARRLAALSFAAIVVGAFVSQWRVMVDNAAEVLPPAMAVNVVAMALAALVGRGLQGRERIAVVLETGLQNGALGIFVAATLLQSPAMMVPSIVYALVMNVTALAVVSVLRPRYCRLRL